MSVLFRQWLGPLMPCLGLLTLHAATIPNGSFEQNGNFTVAPGYASQNGGSITGWTITGKAGLNRTGGAFANNGAIPDGLTVAFLQSDADVPATLATTITGLTLGYGYLLKFRTNMRSGTAAPSASYSIDGQTAVSFPATPAVGGTNACGTAAPVALAASAVPVIGRLKLFKLVRAGRVAREARVAMEVSAAVAAGSVAPVVWAAPVTGPVPTRSAEPVVPVERAELPGWVASPQATGWRVGLEAAARPERPPAMPVVPVGRED